MSSAGFEILDDVDHALAAAEWARAFYPDLIIEVRNEVLVQSQRRDANELSLIWKIAIANERLRSQGQSHRAAVLTELLA